MADGKFTPTNNGVLTVTGGDDTTCVHLVWSGYRDGDYEDYKERTYPLDSSLTLLGIPKLDADGNLYYDGDTYKSDGTVTRRFCGVSSAVCTVAAYGEYVGRWALLLPNDLPAMKNVGIDAVANIFVNNYFTPAAKNNVSTSSKYLISQGDGYGERRRFIFSLDKDVITTVEAASAWVVAHPFTVVYERVSTTENAEPFASPQIVDDFGTEEYEDYGVLQNTRDVSIPVGHETRYLANLRDKLQHLPSLAGEDGDYIIQQNGQQMSLKPAPKAVQFVTLTPTSLSTAEADKTNDEIYTLIKAGFAVKIIVTLGQWKYTADVSVTSECIDPADESYGMTNLIATLANPVQSAFYIISTGDTSYDNTNWNLDVVPFAS